MMTLVLIYPYWNVNIAIMTFCNGSGKVLIYPYWNVNKAMTYAELEAASFNLSILECKSGKGRPHCTCCGVLIYPYWNVNRNCASSCTSVIRF